MIANDKTFLNNIYLYILKSKICLSVSMFSSPYFFVCIFFVRISVDILLLEMPLETRYSTSAWFLVSVYERVD